MKTQLILGDVLDVHEGRVLRDHALMVEGGRISAMVPAASVRKNVPADAEILDFTGACVMPGLCDAHNHLSLDAMVPDYLSRMTDREALLAMRALVTMKRDLASGVTLSRSCGDKAYLDILFRNLVARGELAGPELIVSGLGIRSVHGHGFVGTPADGMAEILSIVRKNIKEGVDFQKLFLTSTLPKNGFVQSFMTAAEIKAAIDLAHRGGIQVTAHCIGGVALDDALDAGIDSIEHGFFMTGRHIERMVRDRRTLVVTPWFFMDESGFAALPQEEKLLRKELFAKIRKTMTAALKAGLPFTIGTDGRHGTMATEMSACVSFGASSAEVLRAATLGGATLCEMADKTGSLGIGKQADLLVIEGDPLADIMAVSKVRAVFSKGARIR